MSESGAKEWRNEKGELHREDGPAVIRATGSKEWYINGLRHREDGPAVIRSSGVKEWYQYGKRHREDGPSKTGHNGAETWHFKGELHREDEPARINGGIREWYQYGKRHRVDGPAIEKPSGHKVWYINGLKHREDGPAVEGFDGKLEYWTNGVLDKIASSPDRMIKEEFRRKRRLEAQIKVRQKKERYENEERKRQLKHAHKLEQNETTNPKPIEDIFNDLVLDEVEQTFGADPYSDVELDEETGILVTTRTNKELDETSKEQADLLCKIICSKEKSLIFTAYNEYRTDKFSPHDSGYCYNNVSLSWGTASKLPAVQDLDIMTTYAMTGRHEEIDPCEFRSAFINDDMPRLVGNQTWNDSDYKEVSEMLFEFYNYSKFLYDRTLSKSSLYHWKIKKQVDKNLSKSLLQYKS